MPAESTRPLTEDPAAAILRALVEEMDRHDIWLVANPLRCKFCGGKVSECVPGVFRPTLLERLANLRHVAGCVYHAARRFLDGVTL